MIKPSAALLILLLVSACSTTSGDDVDVELPPKPAPAPVDPRVSDLQVTVNELTDRIEVLQSRIHQLEKREPAPRTVRTAAAQPAPIPQAAVPQPRVAVPEPRVVVQVPPESRPSPSGAAGGTQSRAIASAEIADSYREALALFGKGALDRARNAFQQIFDADPSGELADNALYWIGETYFTTAKYGDAIRIFERIEADYADQNKAPDAIFKIGSALAKQGDLALARRTYQRLIEKYPYSTPAAAARVELNRIKY